MNDVRVRSIDNIDTDRTGSLVEPAAEFENSQSNPNACSVACRSLLRHHDRSRHDEAADRPSDDQRESHAATRKDGHD